MNLLTRCLRMLLLFILVYGNVHGQEDSLKTVLANAKHDTAKISALVKLSDICAEEDILKYTEPAIMLLEKEMKLHDPASKTYTHFEQQLASVLSNQGYYYNAYNQHAEGIHNHERALQLYKKLKDESNVANSYSGIGEAQVSLGNYPLALDNFTKGLAICEKIHDSVIMAPILNGIAGIYTRQGNYVKSFPYINRSLDVYKGIGDKEGVGKQLSTLCDIYQRLGDSEKAIEYGLEALKIIDRTGSDQFSLAQILHNIAHIYIRMDNFEKSKAYYKRCLTISEKLDFGFAKAYCYVGIGQIYLKQALPDTALVYLNKALELSKKLRYKSGECLSLAEIGECYLQKRDLSNAIINAEKALILAKEMNNFSNIQTSVQVLYKVYKQKGLFAKALEMYELNSVMQDSIHSKANQKALMRSQIQQELDKAAFQSEQQIFLLQNEKIQADALAGKRKTQFWLMLATALLIGTLFLFFIYRSRSNKKRKEIEFEKSKLEYEQQALRAQMNPHFIFNAINSIQKYILDKNEREAYDYLAKFAKLIRIVLNNSQEKVLLLQQELDMILLYIELEQIRFKNKFEFTMDIEPTVNTIEIAVPAMMMQPYIENAIWHGLMNLRKEKKGILKLQISRDEKELKITIEDNGIGREKAMSYKKSDKHRSVGMALTEQRLLMLNKMEEYGGAKVEVLDLYENNTATGTRVEITLPIN